MTDSGAADTSDAQQDGFPRVPAYAWAWLQRSRPVLAEAADRLTGAPATAGFIDRLHEDFEADPFTRDVLIGVIADIAFGGRVPRFRPIGASWDRGLTWWASAIAGTTPDEFEQRTATAVTQDPLFGVDDPAEQPAPTPKARPRRAARDERAMVIRALRQLLQSSDGDTVPVAAVRQLLSNLGADDTPADRQ